MKQTLPTTRRSPAAAVASILGVWALHGCAAPDGVVGTVGAPAVAAEAAAFEYTVKRGDALAAIAARLTGDASQWRAIASHNGIADPRRLAVGQRIRIPAAWLASGAGDGAGRDAGAPLPATTAGAPDPGEPSALLERSEPVTLSAVDPNRRFELDPLDAPAIGSIPRRVRVIGSYYPVALYTEPRNGAPLSGRVNPGTLFSLDRELDGWWQLDTGTGTAYLRRNDGSLLSSSE